MKKVISLIVLCMSSFVFFAQDIILLKTGAEVQCKITEVGEDQVKYKEWNFTDGPDFVISVQKISKIKFSNGREQSFEQSDLMLGPPPDKVFQKRQAVKVGFFNFLVGNTVLGYERVQKLGLNWEAEVGIIGLGKQDVLNNKERGAWITVAPKMLLRKQTYMRGERYRHFFHGAYFKPALGFEYQTGTQPNYYYYGAGSDGNTDYRLTSFSLMLNMGYQWLLGDLVTLDVYAGVGMSSDFAKYDKKNLNEPYFYYRDMRSRHVLGTGGNNGDLGIAFTSGLKLGIAF